MIKALVLPLNFLLKSEVVTDSSTPPKKVKIDIAEHPCSSKTKREIESVTCRDAQGGPEAMQAGMDTW